MKLENLKIYTCAGQGVIENGYLEFENGKITGIGVCDGKPSGLTAYPGFIDAHTHLGIIGDSVAFEGDDVNETGDPATPHLRAIDAVNPFDRSFKEAREAGVTCVASGPGSANPLAGQFCILKTFGKRVDDMLLAAPSAMKAALGENPKSVYHGKDQSPETRMATAAIIREQLIKARKYSADLLKYEKDPENEDEPEYDMKLEALLPVIRGELPVHFHAHRADDIFTAMRIAKEFSLRYVIVHGTDGYLIADALMAEGVSVISGPSLTDRSKPELKNQSLENPMHLMRSGVKTAVTTDHPETPIQYLTLCAAMAVRAGMNSEDALKAITVYPAEILGISDRVGSLSPGKDADIVIMDGDLFDYRSKVKEVYINGLAVRE